MRVEMNKAVLENNRSCDACKSGILSPNQRFIVCVVVDRRLAGSPRRRRSTPWPVVWRPAARDARR